MHPEVDGPIRRFTRRMCGVEPSGRRPVRRRVAAARSRAGSPVVFPVLAVVAAALTAVEAAPLGAQRAPLDGLDAYVERALEDWGVPGVGLAVVKGDDVALASGYGVRDVGTGEPVDERTLFAIGSSSKAFTAAAVGMLVDADRLGWDDRAIDHLPEFRLHDPYATRELTIRDLLSHRSGLSRGDLLWYGSDFSRDEILRRVRHLEPSWSFRSRFGYQNLMYLAAGRIVARVSGMSWDEYIERRIFDPLGMDASSTSVDALAGLSNVARPHAEIDDEVRPIEYRDIDNIAPAGSINSNAIDMAKWVRVQLADGRFEDETLLSGAVMAEMRKPHTIIEDDPYMERFMPGAHFRLYGLGWFLADYRDRMVVMHGGNIDGMSALVATIPEEDLGVVVLTNLNGNLLPYAIAYRVFDAYLGPPADGAEPTDWSAEMLEVQHGLEREAERQIARRDSSRVEDTSPSLPLERYAGEYHDSLYGGLDVRVDDGDGGLVLERNPSFVADLEHWHYDTFLADWRDPTLGETLVTFTLDAGGEIDALDAGDLMGEFDRIGSGRDEPESVAIDEAAMRRLTGTYASPDIPVEVTVERIGELLKLVVPGQPAYTLVPLSEVRFRLDGAPD
ncbi:MAG: serine hydrolase, partial [Gemmatimonadota bacterium]